MKRVIPVFASVVLAAANANAQGAQLPEPTINDAAKTAALSLGPRLLITRMMVNPVSGTTTMKPFMIGTCNVVVLNIENLGGNLFPGPVDVVLTGYSRSQKVPPVTYRYTIDGSTRYITPMGKKIYVVTYRNVRVSSTWPDNNWFYKAEMKSAGKTIGNQTELPVGWEPSNCT